MRAKRLLICSDDGVADHCVASSTVPLELSPVKHLTLFVHLECKVDSVVCADLRSHLVSNSNANNSFQTINVRKGLATLFFKQILIFHIT